MTKSYNNIILNAYLMPLFDEKTRKRTFSLCQKAEIDMFSHVYPSEHWIEDNHTIEWYKEAMEEAATYGMKLMTMDTTIQKIHGESVEFIKNYAENFKGVNGFGGFFIADEPINPNIYAYVDNALNEVFPDVPNNVNFFPRCCYPDWQYIRQLYDYGALTNPEAVLSLDAYCYRYGEPYQAEELYLNYNDLRRAGLRTEHNTAAYIQSVGLNGGYRRPERAAMRHNMLTAIAYGIKQLKFFTWGTPPHEEGDYTISVFDRDYMPTDLYDEAVITDHKIHTFGKILAHCDCMAPYFNHPIEGVTDGIPADCPVQVISDSPVLMSVFCDRECPSKQYLMFVNNNLENYRELKFKFAGEIKNINSETGELVDVANEDGVWTYELIDGGAAMFTLPDGTFNFEIDDANLTLSAHVHASSSAGADKKYIYNICDGVADSTGAKLLFTDNKDQFVTFDFGKEKSFNRVDVYPCGEGEACGRYYPKQFEIRTSSDGESWKTIAAYTKETNFMDKVPVFEFPTESARYVQIYLICQGGMPNFAELGEICIYNDDGSIEKDIKTGAIESTFVIEEREDIAYGKPVVGYSSTVDQPSWGCSHQFITDGTEKVWASELNAHSTPDATEWICIDLCGEYEVNKVRILPQEVANGSNGFPVNYNIQVSLDGKTFTMMSHYDGDNGQTDESAREIPLAPVKARFIKFEATKLGRSGVKGAGYAIELREIEVYAVK